MVTHPAVCKVCAVLLFMEDRTLLFESQSIVSKPVRTAEDSYGLNEAKQTAREAAGTSQC